MTLLELQELAAEQDITEVRVDLFETVDNGREAFVYVPLSPDVAFLRFPVSDYDRAWREVERQLEPIGLVPCMGKGWR